MAVLLGAIGAARRRTESADESSEIKKVLKLAFPKIKFSVRKRAGGNSVTIEWENGPTVREVQAYTKDFEMGSFDGMTDMYTYDNRNKNIPQVKYLFLDREMSKNLKAFMQKEIEKTHSFKGMDEWEKEREIYRLMREDFKNSSLPAGLSGVNRKRIGFVKL
jgi:ABC-type dipeptide/oligopeptide/nickel transport system ATPase subunit